jgi:leucyl-tRNA synthetase
MSNKYEHKKVELKWHENWTRQRIYEPEDIKAPKRKFYNLMMFPYPSAEGLHAGNVFAFTGSDVYGRFKRMQGYDVFEPIGLDGFGIHSENYAIKTGTSPLGNAKRTQDNFYRQLHEIGNGFDWRRTLETYDPDYYRWTQWVFVQFFKAGLAYRKSAEVNWCPSCKTVLADEQAMSPKAAGKLPEGFKSFNEVPEGLMVCERCGTQVTRRKLEQWFFRITDDADRLLDNLKDLNWPKRIKTAQRNWIGKKSGVNITYNIEDTDLSITCWTSRPDTNFGATFIVVSPDNPILDKISTNEYKAAVGKYIKNCKKVPSAKTAQNNKKKTGVFTGTYAINSLNGERLPIWVSDFVLMGVGTGAVVGVPGHDKRDFEFAIEFNIPIKRVVVGPDGDKSKITRIEQVQEEEGHVIDSEFLNGLDVRTAKKKIIQHLVKEGYGKRRTVYHLRDWSIARQRYWGPPIPMIFCKTCAKHGLSWFNNTPEGITKGYKTLNDKQTDWMSAGWYPDENLPVLLPDIEDYLPKGEGHGPLADHPEFYKVNCPVCGNEAYRETDVSDTFLDSAWYFLRYPSIDAKSSTELPFDVGITKGWLPVDLYFGGAEHAVLHLMYARFVTHVLHDLGFIGFEEPFPRFYAHGLMIKDGAKMSKSKGNIVNPDMYIEKYGADTLRLYLMFMGPMDGSPDFRDTGIEGMRRFVERAWDLFQNYPASPTLSTVDENLILIKMHRTIKKVTEDIGNFKYNTAISAIMEYVNALRTLTQDSELKTQNKPSAIWNRALEVLAQLLAPFAPHMTEEVWSELLGKKGSVHKSLWPKYQNKLAESSQAILALQVNGKLRGTLTVSLELAGNKKRIIELARDNPRVTKYLEGKTIRRTIFVPGKILNFVLNR